MDSTTKSLLKYLILPLVILVVVVWVADRQTRPDFLMHIDFLNVGQGDATFIQTYLGSQVIIDGGPSDKILSELGKQMPFFDRSIDLLILTHPDADHISGFVDVLKRYQIKKVLLTGVQTDTQVYKKFMETLGRERAEIIYAVSGQRIWLDNATVFDIYYPLPGSIADQSMPTNDTSIIGKLSFGKTEVLFTGDASSKIEDSLLPLFDLDADVLKVAHHGSKTSTSIEFLKEVDPEYAVIEVGKNSYGHPTDEVLSRLNQAQAQVLRTDINNPLGFVSDGTNLYRK